jgi:hypothetical protein
MWYSLHDAPSTCDPRRGTREEADFACTLFNRGIEIPSSDGGTYICRDFKVEMRTLVNSWSGVRLLLCLLSNDEEPKTLACAVHKLSTAGGRSGLTDEEKTETEEMGIKIGYLAGYPAVLV